MRCSHATYLAAYDALTSVDDAHRLAEDGSLGLPFDSLFSILMQKMVSATKASMGRHRQPAVSARYVDRYESGETLVDIARTEHLPPSMLARVVLEQLLGLKKGKAVGQFIKRPEGIEDARLREEVTAAVENDPFYGPRVDTTRRLIGLEYECTLHQALRCRGIPFFTEEDLRASAAARTPDVLLPVPVCVKGRQIHWIDSKATFGDPNSHAEYHASQFTAYLNRFDSGLVIYWFGFDESVDTDARILILDRFPSAECDLMSHFVSPAIHDASVGGV